MSDSEFEVPRAALRERYSSPPVTSTSDTTSALPSQPTTPRPRLALFSIPSTPPLQPAKPRSTIASTGATSKKGQSHWISLKTLTKNHPNSTITVASTPTSITTTKGKAIYKQEKLACVKWVVRMMGIRWTGSDVNRPDEVDEGRRRR